MKVLGYGFIVMLLLVYLAGCTHSPCSSQHKIALIHSYQRGYNNVERINRLFADELKKNGLQCEIKVIISTAKNTAAQMKNVAFPGSSTIRIYGEPI